MEASTPTHPDSNHSFLEEHFHFEKNIDSFGITLAFLYLVVCIVGLAGNCLVITAILKLDKMSSSTTVYLFNLALADGLFMVGLPFIASQFFQEWVFGNMACKVVMFLDGINQFTSVFCLTAISIDRYMALTNPLRFASWRTPRCAKVVSMTLWFLSFLTILPMAYHFTAHHGLCSPDFPTDTWSLGVLSYTFVIGFALPYSMMTISYTAMLVSLWSKHNHCSSPNDEGRRLEKQITKMVVAVVVVFGICWLPFYFVNFLSWSQKTFFFTYARAYELVVLLSYSWSCANPILYACLSDTFRNHFRTLLCPGVKSSSSMQSSVDRNDPNVTCVLDVSPLA
ncbi:PREDICTED: somatostatin receptor type 2-like [Cyprinodon variegatus]|uniref:somatostatin receptor type 2-like n=1 Tax=Cyprinodon variegatus TaxID=28743 RepID=UPI00074296AF|nr:PREDICTED: somatostatin receptor type 2-like [Cyprinodon variegatus]